MEIVTLVYLIMAIMTAITMLVIVIIIAGKDIFYAFYRRFVPKGCDIFIISFNRQVNYHYRIPKNEGFFKIKGQTYVLNPNKVLSLSEDEKLLVEKSLKKRELSIKTRILDFTNKKNNLIEQNKKLEGLSNVDALKNQILTEIENYNEKIIMLEDKLKDKNKTYYHRRRPLLFYIENDPVPKDMFEFYTEFDSAMIDNIIARSMTKDPKAVQDLEKYLKLFKMALLVIGGATLIALFVAFKTQTAITQIADHLGVVIKV